MARSAMIGFNEPGDSFVIIKLSASALVTLAGEASTPPVEPKCAPLTNLQKSCQTELCLHVWMGGEGVKGHYQVIWQPLRGLVQSIQGQRL